MSSPPRFYLSGPMERKNISVVLARAAIARRSGRPRTVPRRAEVRSAPKGFTRSRLRRPEAKAARRTIDPQRADQCGLVRRRVLAGGFPQRSGVPSSRGGHRRSETPRRRRSRAVQGARRCSRFARIGPPVMHRAARPFSRCIACSGLRPLGARRREAALGRKIEHLPPRHSAETARAPKRRPSILTCALG